MTAACNDVVNEEKEQWTQLINYQWVLLKRYEQQNMDIKIVLLLLYIFPGDNMNLILHDGCGYFLFGIYININSTETPANPKG